jgi:hypothetical protein
MAEKPKSTNHTPAQQTDSSELQKLDVEIKQVELLIRNLELEKARLPNKLNWSIIIPALATILAAVLLFISNAYVASLDREKSLAVEKAKLQSSLILSAVATNDEASARKNIKFFLQTGLLEDPDGKLAKTIEEGQIPVLPAVAPGNTPPHECPAKPASLISTSGEVSQNGIQLYIESCAYRVGGNYLYVYRVQNNGNRGAAFRWDRVSLSMSLLSPLPPGTAASLSRTDVRPPVVEETKIYIGNNDATAPFQSVVPREVNGDSKP